VGLKGYLFDIVVKGLGLEIQNNDDDLAAVEEIGGDGF